MGLFGPSKREIAEAVTEALAATLPDALAGIKIDPVFNVTYSPSDYQALADAVTSALPDKFEVEMPEVRPARGWEKVTEDMLGKDLPVRPHALWANGPMAVTLVDDIGSEEVFRTDGHAIEASPVQITKIEAGPGVTLLALYP